MTKKSGFELYKDEKKEWRWRFQAPNGESIAVSGEGYHNRLDCLRGAVRTQDYICNLDLEKIVLEDTLKQG